MSEYILYIKSLIYKKTTFLLKI